MPHLLIDADRIPAKHTAKLDGHRLHFFSKHKKVLKKQKQYDCYRGNVPAEIAGCLKDMLRLQDNVRAVVVSPRKKVRAAAEALQAVYPDAEVRVWRKLGKKQRARLAARLPETAAPPTLPEERETAPVADSTPTVPPLDDAPAVPADDTTAPAAETEMPPPAPAADEETVPPPECAEVAPSEAASPALPDTADCPTFQAACAFIRKNRPKKKISLLNALCEHLNLPPLAAERLAAQLADAGKIRVDAAENVRYL